MRLLLLLPLADTILASSPCPFGGLAERGLLPTEDADKFFAARSDGEVAVEAQLKSRREADHAAQEEFYKRQVSQGQLPLGGGYLRGVLQPFTGGLSGLEVPVPQPSGLQQIPGNDPSHQFQYPGPTDVRGACPVLNTMANHGYISRNGITTFAEAGNACQIAMGIAYDNCVLIAALGVLTGGDMPTGKFSIGGADSRVPNTLGPALGLDRHGFFESDNSITRQDAYFGNQANFQIDRWNRLVNITTKYKNQFGFSTFAEERVLVYKESKQTNPEFYAGLRWLFVSALKRVLVIRGLPNGTDPNNVSYASVAPFFLNETFPSNWSRRAWPYDFKHLLIDMITLYAVSKEVTLPGQNQGLNNFIPFNVDFRKLSPSAAACFIAATILDNTPGYMAPALLNQNQMVQAFLNGAVSPFVVPSNCSVNNFAYPGPGKQIVSPGQSTSSNIIINGVYQ